MFLPENAPSRDGQPFELALAKAIVGVANADGHIDAEEQRHIFDQLGNPPSLWDIAALAERPEQGAGLSLVSHLAIDPDHPIEKLYLETLESRLSLPGELW